jgi:hypothetical protein
VKGRVCKRRNIEGSDEDGGWMRKVENGEED